MDPGNNRIVEIKTIDKLYKGEYRFNISGITDNSTEENELKKVELIVDFEGDEYVEEEIKTDFFQKFWWAILVFFILIVIVVIYIVYLIVKKRHGIVVVDGKATFVDNTDVKQHLIIEKVESEKKSGLPIILDIRSGSKTVKIIRSYIDGSIIVGRSNICDIIIDDAMMSRQHFAIENDGNEIYIQDLDTRNGTYLNGIKLKSKRKLEKEDNIRAGSIDIIIRW